MKQAGRATATAATTLAAATAAAAAARLIKRRQGKLARNRGAASNWEAPPHAPSPPFPPPGRGRAALSPPGPLSASAASVPAAAPPLPPERQHPRQYWESRGSAADHPQVFSFSRPRRHPLPLPFARHMWTAAASHAPRPVVADVTRTDIIVLGCWHAPQAAPPACGAPRQVRLVPRVLALSGSHLCQQL